eukprot:Ihof_evm10s71 gene=Ihof_evmTU10s71
MWRTCTSIASSVFSIRGSSQVVGLRQLASWSDLPLKDSLVKSLLATGLECPTAIQEKALPLLLNDTHSDVIVGAETGSGKTLAYLIPILNRVAGTSPPRAKALVVVPSLELCNQVAQVAQDQDICHIARAYSTSPMTVLPDTGVVVATPGVLAQYDLKTLLADVTTVVLDEADKLLSGGMAEPMKRLFTWLSTAIPKPQVVVVAATLPQAGTKSVAALIHRHFPQAIHVRTQRMHCMVNTLQCILRSMEEEDKSGQLCEVLNTIDSQAVLVFLNKAAGVKALLEQLVTYHPSCVTLHAEMTPSERVASLAQFREGQARILLATDVASRGLDLPNVSTVVQYDFATDATTYLHRAGRTARAGANGTMISFITPQDKPNAKLFTEMGSTGMEGAFSRRRSI